MNSLPNSNSFIISPCHIRSTNIHLIRNIYIQNIFFSNLKFKISFLKDKKYFHFALFHFFYYSDDQNS